MTKIGKAALAAGLTAMVATTPLPAIAAHGTQQLASAPQQTSAYHDASGYYRPYWRKRRLDVDAGDIILGIGLIAAIAAIADAADKDGNRDRRRTDRRYDEERPYNYDRSPRYNGGDDIGTAITACSEAAERIANRRVDEIGSVTRDGTRWRVEGEIGNNVFTCSVSDGRVDDIRIGNREI